MRITLAPGWSRRLIALCLLAGSLLAVVSAQRTQGVVRDEVIYMNSGSTYAAWWLDLFAGKSGTVSEKRITAHFGGGVDTTNNRKHPPPPKNPFCPSKRVFSL